VGACQADYRPAQVTQGLVAVPEAPPCAVHGDEGVLRYFFGQLVVTEQKRGDPGQGAVMLVVKSSYRLVSIPPGRLVSG
jgi:hypothetical protein